MKVFVAGHKGLVGSAVVRRAPKGIQLITKDRSALDLTNQEAILNLFSTEKPDCVVLAAAKVGGIKANSLNHRDFLYENLQIQNTVMYSAATVGIQNFIFLGSSCIYPKYAKQPISESSLLTGPLEETNEGYALAKIAGIRLAKAISDQNNLNFFSLMPTNLYGPNDNFDLQSSHVPAALIRKFHEAKVTNMQSVQVWGSGKARREFMHVDDMADACWYMMDKKVNGELINVGTGRDLPIKDFAQLIAKIIGFNGEIIFDSTMPEGTPQKLLDTGKISSFGWRPKIDLESGIFETYKWFTRTLDLGVVRGY